MAQGVKRAAVGAQGSNLGADGEAAEAPAKEGQPLVQEAGVEKKEKN